MLETICISFVVPVVWEPIKDAPRTFVQSTAESLLTVLRQWAVAALSAISGRRNPADAAPGRPASANIVVSEQAPSRSGADNSDASGGVKADKIFELGGSTGKICCMLSARDLVIEWGRDKRYWRWSSWPGSRFPEVAELLEVWWFEITGKVDMKELSPETTYAAYLVFALREQPEGLDDYLESSVEVGGYQSKRRVCLAPTAMPTSPAQGSDAQLEGPLVLPRRREDGWMEMELGEFFVDQGIQRGVVQVKVREVDTTWKKSGLILEGMEVRPKNSG